MNAQTAETVSITTATIGQFGRYLVSARTNHFVSDQRVAVGGPGEAINAGELLLSSLGSCSLGLMQKTAKEQGIVLREAGSEVSFRRHASDPTQYEWIRIAVRLSGVTAGEGRNAGCRFHRQLPDLQHAEARRSRRDLLDCELIHA